jgi:hypothetical protein
MTKTEIVQFFINGVFLTIFSISNQRHTKLRANDELLHKKRVSKNKLFGSVFRIV